MRHLELFENFNEARMEIKVEAARASNGKILFKCLGKFVAKLGFSVYHKDVDEKRNEEIEDLMLKTFPASEEWKSECEKYKDNKVYGLREEVLLAAAKERSSGNEEGQIQLWDESKLTHSISMGGPFSDQKNRISGKYVGGVFFTEGLSKLEVGKITKIFNTAFPGSGKTKTWIVSN